MCEINGPQASGPHKTLRLPRRVLWWSKALGHIWCHKSWQTMIKTYTSPMFQYQNYTSRDVDYYHYKEKMFVRPFYQYVGNALQVRWIINIEAATREVSLGQICMMTSSNGNIFRVTGPLCGEFTDPGEFPTQRPVTRSFDVFFDLRLNKRLSKQPWGWWFETLSWSLWRRCNGDLLSWTHSHTSEIKWVVLSTAKIFTRILIN